MWNGLIPHPHVTIKNEEEYLSGRGLPRRNEVPIQNQAPQLRAPVPGRKVSIISGCEYQRRLWLGEMEGR